jgi:lysylphosphatidylglycerol synthetase-like protein (DUF2156 family)
MLRHMPQERSVTPGHTVIYPNRDKATSKLVKLIVVVLMLASAALMLAITFGGWSKLEGLKPVDFIWALVYVIIAFYVTSRWARGLLPIAAAMAILLLITAVIAGTGASGTSWFDRSNFGFGPAKSLFGGSGFGPDTLGTLTVLLIPVQALLIMFAGIGFAQGWNVELEVPIDEARRRGYDPPPAQSSPPPGEPAPA